MLNKRKFEGMILHKVIKTVLLIEIKMLISVIYSETTFAN